MHDMMGGGDEWVHS